MLTPDQAEDLAGRTLARIDGKWPVHVPRIDADRERVASDLAGFRECSYAIDNHPEAAQVAMLLRIRFAHGLRRTAALYGVEL